MSGANVDSVMRRELAQFRAAREANDARTRAALTRTYGALYKQTRRDLDKLLEFIQREQLMGRRVKSWRFHQRNRLERMLADTERRLQSFGQDATRLIRAEQAQAVQLGSYAAGKLIRTALREAPTRVTSQFGRTSPGTIDAVTAAVHSTPLHEVFVKRAGLAAKAAEDVLTTGVASGWHPSKIAREFRSVLGRDLTNAMTIARTEAMRAHRQAAYATYADNSDVVTGMIWHANEATCCAACLAMHGTPLELGEEVDGHPNCMCDAVPETVSYAELGFPGIAEPFDPIEPGSVDGLSVESMVERFGNRSLATALADGRISLRDVVHQSHSPVWGSMRRQASYTQALENAAARRAA